MKREITCRYCGKLLGHGHGNQVASWFTHHFRTEHKQEYEEMKKLKQKLGKLLEHYHYKGHLI